MSRTRDSRTRDLVAFSIAAAAGAAVWLAVCRLASTEEAWDHPLYLSAGLPTLAAITGILGYLVRGRAVQLGLACALGQAAALLVGGIGMLLPLGLVLLVLASVPAMLTAWLGAVLAARVASHPAS